MRLIYVLPIVYIDTELVILKIIIVKDSKKFNPKVEIYQRNISKVEFVSYYIVNVISCV